MKAKKKRILVLVETSRTYGRQMIEGITTYSIENGGWVLFVEDRGLQKTSSRYFQRFRCDGIISRTIDSWSAAHLESLGVPVVELLGDGKRRFSDIMCDGPLLGKMAAEYYVGLGLKHFAFFSIGQSWWSEEFFIAFEEELKSHDRRCHQTPFHHLKNSASLSLEISKDHEKAIVRWLRSLPKPVGIFCPSDSLAVYLSNLCLIEEIPVPHEILILGVENNKTLCNATSPPLSSIAVDGRSVGYQAGVLLDKMIRKVKLPLLPIRIPPMDIVTRASTNMIAISDPDVAKALHFISQSVISQITVRDIADSVDLSTRTLIRKFHQFLNCTPESFLKNERFERAKVMLRETDLTVSRIAEALGFCSVEYFVRAFRQATKRTPKQYRQKVLSDAD